MKNYLTAATYVQNSLQEAYQVVKSTITDSKTGAILNKRADFYKIKALIDDFHQNNNPRWISIEGLRGIGKTTLLCQLYQHLDELYPQRHKLFISVDMGRRYNFDLSQILDAHEDIIGQKYISLKQPIYLILDEVHFDSSWALTLKTIFDRCPQVFIIASGSSSYSLDVALTTDAARRVFRYKMHPLSLTEYWLLAGIKLPVDSLNFSRCLRQIIYGQDDCRLKYKKLLKLTDHLKAYWFKRDYEQQLREYLTFGNIPDNLNHPPQRACNQMVNTMQTIAQKDIPIFYSLKTDTSDKMMPILHELAFSSIVSVRKLSSNHQLHRQTVESILNALTRADVLCRLFPHGSHKKQVGKSSKYLFTSSNYRNALFNNQIIPSSRSYDQFKSFLLEDVVNLYFLIFRGLFDSFKVCHDDRSGADFILQFSDRKIAVEVGIGAKDFKQVEKSVRRHQCDFGLTISKSELGYKDNLLSLPLKFFLLSA